MNILGIETSCDETSASVVTDGVKVLSNIIATSLKEHQAFGGIIPEIASRKQMELIYWVVAEALAKSSLTLKDLSAVAVTTKPGLMGSLVVGISFARGLAKAIGKPLIEVDHIKAHLYANYLSFADHPYAPLSALPAVGLVVSGGHSSLYYLEGFKSYELMGITRDDAAGEAFDKVARLLDLGYPGGPVIDRLAKEGVNDEIKFPQARLKGSYDFSFSGLKTAVLYYAKAHQDKPNFNKAKVVYSFQESVVSVLVEKAIAACQHKKCKTLLIGGGVAANSALRQRLSEAAKANGINLYQPPFALCLDNAAMIAGLGYHWRR